MCIVHHTDLHIRSAKGYERERNKCKVLLDHFESMLWRCDLSGSSPIDADGEQWDDAKNEVDIISR